MERRGARLVEAPPRGTTRRVAVLAPRRERCGVADYARQLSAALPQRYEVVPIELPTSGDRPLWQATAAAADDCDVVHVHYEYGLFHSVKPFRNRLATLLQGLGVPVVVSLHDALPRLVPRWRERRSAGQHYRAADLLRDLAYLPYFERWERSLYAMAAHWVVHSEEHHQHVVRFASPQRVTQMLHPVPSRGEEWSETWSAEQREPSRLVTPGFVKAHKGLERLARAVAELPGVEWWVVGGAQDERDEATLQRIEELSAALGIGERLRITGYLPAEEVDRLLCEGDVAVFPYQAAAGSGAVSWAVAVGMPVITSDLPAFVELAEAGAGIRPSLPSENPSSWAQRIGDALARPGELQALASANRTYAREYGYAEAGERLAAIFDRLIEA